MSDAKRELVTTAEIQAFQRDGAICLQGVFEERWLDVIARGIEQNLANPSEFSESLDAGAGRFFNDYCNWQKIPEYRAYVMASPAAEIAARLMGSSKAIFYHEHLLIKEPGNLSKTPWHQDQPYYPVAGRQMCSIWMPLDPVPVESSLQFVKGSHAQGPLYIPRKFATQKNYQLKDESDLTGLAGFENVPDDIDARPDKYEILSWALEPGDCVVFYGATLHGAAGNVSLDRSRRAFSTRWFGEEARFVERPWALSPPFTGGLQVGEGMGCELFPVVWEGGKNE
jgi:ectoine hydroxylase-related dioxygenase (phytanoyl-CoA dioxygenase family)